MNPLWIEALWPICIFIGGLIWFGGRQRGVLESISTQTKDLERSQQQMTAGYQGALQRLDRFDIRLTTTETNVVNQGRILDRIEGKLDRLIEARHTEARR